MNYLEKRLDSAVEEWADQAVDDLKGQGKAMANQMIGSVADRVQNRFIDKIGDDAFRKAATGTLKSMSSVDGLMNAFSATKSAGMLRSTLGDIGDDIEIFLKGGIDRVELYERVVDKADKFISGTIEKMATTAAAEFGPLAPAVGKLAGYVASTLLREAVAPILNAARRAKYARQRYEQLHGLYEEAIAQMQRQRELFERETAALFQRRQQLIDDSFVKLDAALSLNDVNRASDALNSIAKEFGSELKFKTVDEFNDFILNSDEELIL